MLAPAGVAFGSYLLDSRARSLSRAGWQDVAVGVNSLEKLVSKLRRHLDAEGLNRYIKTVPRQGYQFRPAVMRFRRSSDGTADALVTASPWASGERVALRVPGRP